MLLYNMANFYELDESQIKEHIKKQRLLVKKGEMPLANFYCNLGYLHNRGFGVKKCSKTARKYYEKAAKLGDEIAIGKIAEYQAIEDGFSKDIDFTNNVPH